MVRVIFIITAAMAIAAGNFFAQDWTLVGNAGTDPTVNFVGTTDNQPVVIRADDKEALRIYPDVTSPKIVAGCEANYISAGYGNTIAGGGELQQPNIIAPYTNFATISGGSGNRANGWYSTIGGGTGNETWPFRGEWPGDLAEESCGTIGGGKDNLAGSYSTVGGGIGNDAQETGTVGGGSDNTGHNWGTVGGGESNSATSLFSTIGGGFKNDVTDYNADYATIGGGRNNIAKGECAVVPGGGYNEARGNYSFAAGRNAKAVHEGSFVWGDSSDASVRSKGNDAFLARATGGVYFYSGLRRWQWPLGWLQPGVHLAAGSSSWSGLSSRAAKENLAPVDNREILADLAKVRVTTWNYKSQEKSIRHIGPMAEDFYAVFRVGEDDKYLTTVDVDGVALASIQALYEQLKAKDGEIAELRTQVDILTERVAALEEVTSTE